MGDMGYDLAQGVDEEVKLMDAEFLYLFISTIVFLSGFVGIIVKWMITPINKLDTAILKLNFNIEKLTEQNASQDGRINDLKEMALDNRTRITILEQKREK